MTDNNSSPQIIIIAGPNGAGKTTFAREFLPNEADCLHFLALPDADMAAARVAQRVKQGGHDIPEAVIRRRFVAGLANLPRYCELVDDWDVYDNSGPKPILINERAQR